MAQSVDIDVDEAWEIICKNAREAKRLRQSFESAVRKRQYIVDGVNLAFVIIRRVEAGTPSHLSREWVQKTLYRLAQSGGRMWKKKLGASVATVSALMAFYPKLRWASNNRMVEYSGKAAANRHEVQGPQNIAPDRCVQVVLIERI